MPDYESLAERARREERKADEEHYAHVSSAAQRYEASKSPERRAAEERLKASKAAKDAAFAASISKPASTLAPKPAPKPAAAASTPKASTPKRDPDAEYQRGVANGRAAERTRIGKVYDNAKTMGGDAQALKLLATTDMDSTAINAKLYGRDDSLVNAMKARHGLSTDNGGTAKAEGQSSDIWDKAIAKVAAQYKSGGAA